MISKKIILFCLLAALNSACASTLNHAQIIGKIFPPLPPPSGIAVNSQNRVFVGFPRHSGDHAAAALAELKQGKLVAYPDDRINRRGKDDYTSWLVSPHGMWVDEKDTLWVIDDGKIQGASDIPSGAAKIVAIDTLTNRVIRTVPLTRPVLRNDSHYNDLRVDLTHGKAGTAYIANSGFSTRYSLIVVDIASGRQREVLVNQPATSPAPGFMAFLEGKPHVFDPQKQTMPAGGIDGLALDKHSDTLFWTTLSGRDLYSISTATLSDFSASDNQINAAVHFLGQHPANDGLAESGDGTLYFGAYEQQSLIARDPSGVYSVLLHDPATLGWPDALAYRNHALYVSLGQWNRTADLNQGHDLRKPPYLIMRVDTADSAEH